MKSLTKVIVVVFFAISTLPAFSQQEMVAMDEKPDADFEEYQTYAWTSDVEGPSTIFTLNDLALKSTIKDAIQYELDARGYQMAGGPNADLLINFKVFEEATEIPGFTQDPNVIGPDAARELENKKTYQLEKGSLLIQMVDKKDGNVVWQGYASGIMDGEVFDRSPERIRDAVQKIFNKYEHEAE